MPESLIESLYAAVGKGWGPLNDFLAHISLMAGSLTEDDDVKVCV
jgi:hypothetical protein